MRLRRVLRVISRWRFATWLFILWNLGFPVFVIGAVVTAPTPCEGGSELCSEQRVTNDAFPGFAVVLWIVVNAILLCYYAHATHENRGRDR